MEYWKAIKIWVIEHIASFPKCPRTPWDNSWVGRIEEMKLVIYHFDFKPFHDEQKFKSKPRLNNLCFAGLKLVSHSIIKCLHSCYSFNSNTWAFIQVTFPFMAQSCHFHSCKEALITKSMHIALHLFLLIISNVKGKSNMSRASHKLRPCLYYTLKLFFHFSLKSSNIAISWYLAFLTSSSPLTFYI